jgi:uncharacterized DUF497 family protein
MEGAIMWGDYQYRHIAGPPHKVSFAEVREVIESPRTKVLQIAEEDDHPGRRYRLIGRTREGRRLLVVLTVQLDGDLFPVTAFEPGGD